MRIGILGAGKIGSTTARLFTAVGHEVALSHSRSVRSLEAKVQELGPGVRAVTAEEAARFGDLVLLAMPLKATPSLRDYELGGKLVVDAMNYYPERDGVIDFKGGTSSELVARYAQGARLVKAFNTMWFKTLGEEGKPGAPLEERLVLFLAGDDAAAKETVARLIEQIGFAPLDTGSLAQGGKLQQPDSRIYNRPMRLKEAHAALAPR
jgi:predicted dinucleotide-binding enzyme